MGIAAYGRKLRYESIFADDGGVLWDERTGTEIWTGMKSSGSAAVVCDCIFVDDTKGVECDAQRVLTIRVRCEWVD